MGQEFKYLPADQVPASAVTAGSSDIPVVVSKVLDGQAQPGIDGQARLQASEAEPQQPVQPVQPQPPQGEQVAEEEPQGRDLAG